MDKAKGNRIEGGAGGCDGGETETSVLEQPLKNVINKLYKIFFVFLFV